MSFLDILLERQMEYQPHSSDRRQKIIICILDFHRVFKTSLYATVKDWGDREVDFLHLAIMYADVYLASNNQTKVYSDLVVASGCYCLAYKYETDTFETEFIDFLRAKIYKNIWNSPNLLTETIEFERVLLLVLDWKVNLVTPVAFIREYAPLIGVNSEDASRLSLKLLILDICQLPSNWGISSLIMATTDAIDYFSPSNEDIAALDSVREFVTDDWRRFRNENPEIKKVVEGCIC